MPMLVGRHRFPDIVPTANIVVPMVGAVARQVPERERMQRWQKRKPADRLIEPARCGEALMAGIMAIRGNPNLA
jgi:hypothetical protein